MAKKPILEMISYALIVVIVLLLLILIIRNFGGAFTTEINPIVRP